jgi:peptide deformylase
MPIRPLVILPDSRLREKSAPVESINADVRTLVDDMLATMYDAPGIGLAAIQIGVPIQLVVMDLTRPDENGDLPLERTPQVFINPNIVWSSEELRIYEEGCLSIPDYYEEVTRPDRVRFTYQDIEGKKHEVEADGLFATCIQHEVDHLNGVLFIDYLSKLKRDRCVQKFTKAARQRKEA